MDISPDGKLVGVNDKQIFEVDPYQSLCVNKGEAPSPYIAYLGFAISPIGDMYLSDSSTLKKINSDGSLIESNHYVGDVSEVSGIDFSTDGQLYGVSRIKGLKLVKIDPSSANVSVVADLNIENDDKSYFYDIDIDSFNNIRVFSSKTDLMYVFDLSGKLLKTVKLQQPNNTGEIGRAHV